MRDRSIGIKIGVLLCLVPTTVTAYTEEIKVEKLTISPTAYRAKQNVPSYIFKNDDKDSGTILEIPNSPYISGLSSIVIVKREDKQAFGFVSGTIKSEGNHLVLLKVKSHNTGSEPQSIRVGDIRLISSNGITLPYVAIAKGESYLIAKTSLRALNSSELVELSIKPGKEISLTYCFVIPPKSFPTSLQVRRRKTSFSFNFDEIEEYKISSTYLEMAGNLRVAETFEAQEIQGSIMGKAIDVQFSSGISIPKGEIAAALSLGAAKSLDSVELSETILGKKSVVTLSKLYMFSGGAFIPGKIVILEPISTFDLTLSFKKPGIRVNFFSAFRGEKGDVLAAVGPIKQMDNPVLSVH